MSWKAMIWAHKLRVGLGATEYRTLMVLAEHAREDGSKSFPSIDTIGAEGEMGRRTVQRSLQELEAREIIELQTASTRHAPAIWRLRMDLVIEARLETRGANSVRGANSGDEGCQPDDLGVPDDTFRGASLAPEPKTQPKTQPKLEPGRADEGIASAAKRPTKQITSPEFEAFWKHYPPCPRKIDKADAAKAWVRALHTATAAEIIAGIQTYPWGGDPNFYPLPTTWLNKHRWVGLADAGSGERGGLFGGAPAVTASDDSADDWGIKRWVSRLHITEWHGEGADRIACLRGFFAAVTAEEICAAAALPRSWRGDLSLIDEWMGLNWPIWPSGLSGPQAIVRVLKSVRKPAEVRSLKLFDSAVREASAAAGRAT